MDFLKKKIKSYRFLFTFMLLKKGMFYISKTNLTDKQLKELSKNPYIELVNKYYISYTEYFLKKLAYEMTENDKTSRQVFNECGIDTNIVENT